MTTVQRTTGGGGHPRPGSDCECVFNKLFPQVLDLYLTVSLRYRRSLLNFTDQDKLHFPKIPKQLHKFLH